MKKIIFILLLNAMCGLGSYGQACTNLIPVDGFENNSASPACGNHLVNLAGAGWTPINSFDTPDWFSLNTGNLGTGTGCLNIVPSAHNGDKHAGFGIGMTGTDPQKREWIANFNTVNVIISHSYKIEFYYKNYGGQTIPPNVGVGCIIGSPIVDNSSNHNGSGLNVTMLPNTEAPYNSADNGYVKVTSYFTANASGILNFVIGGFTNSNIGTMQYYFVDDVTITESPIPTVPTTAIVCAGEAFDLSYSATNALSYSWSCNAHGAPGAPYNFNSSGSNAHFTGPISNFGGYNQTYDITLIATTLSGCVSTNVFSITVTPSPPIANIQGSHNLCNGGSVTLTCPIQSGNLLLNTIQWYLNGTIIPGAYGPSFASYTATIPGVYTYSYHGTYSPYCGATSPGFTVYDITPTIAITTNPNHPICVGDPVILTAVGTPSGGTYFWSTGDITSSISENPTSSEQYSVSYTYLGCTSTASTTIQVSLPPAPVINGDQSACAANINYTISNFQTSGTYTLTGITNGSAAISGNNINVTWNSNAGGSFTIQYLNVYGCTASTTYNVAACCNNGTVTLDNSSTSNLPANLAPSVSGGLTTVSGQTFSINGLFTVDQDLKFALCTISLGANAKIYVKPGVKFTIIESHLKACEVMWDGIYEDLSSIGIYESVIEDAKSAINVASGGEYKLLHSVFNKNFKSLVVSNNPVTNTTNVVIGCVFTCRNLTFTNAYNTLGLYPYDYNSYPTTVLNPAYPAYPANAKSFTGIESVNSYSLKFGEIYTGDGNIFDNMDNGINLYSSTASIYNSMFENIIENPSPLVLCVGCTQPPPSGNGIYTSNNPNSHSFTSYELIAGGPGNNEPNGYYNCTRGINTNYYNSKILNNWFDHIHDCGISINNANLLTNDIENNGIFNANGGIKCIEMQGTANTYIYNNSINTIGVPSGSFITGYGISVNNASLSNTANLTIKENYIYKPYAGIIMFNVKGAQVELNQIAFTTDGTTASPKAGIKVKGCAALDISDNIINFPSSPPLVSTTLRGIHMQDTPNSTVFRNYLNNMGAGIYMYGDCDVAKLECNEFHTCFNGFVFKDFAQTGATIGDQMPQLPGYIKKSTGNKWIGMSNNPIPTFITGAVHPTALNTLPKWYWEVGNTTDPSLSTMLTLDYQQNYPLTNTNDCTAKMLLDKVQEREINCGKIVRGENTYDTLSAEYLQRDSLYAFYYLKSNDTLLQLGTADDSTYKHFFDLAKTGNIGKFSKVIAYVQDSTVANTEDAKIINQNIITQTSKEENTKIVNSIYLNKIAYEQDTTNILGLKYPFDSTETATLLNVAYQNPFMGGDAVYMARVLLFMDVEDDVDVVEKMMGSNGYKESIPANFILYPNPNNGKMKLDYKIDESQTGILTIYDITGKLVSNHTFNNNNTTMLIDESNIDAGAYFYIIKVNDKKVKSDKLIIVK